MGKNKKTKGTSKNADVSHVEDSDPQNASRSDVLPSLLANDQLELAESQNQPVDQSAQLEAATTGEVKTQVETHSSISVVAEPVSEEPQSDGGEMLNSGTAVATPVELLPATPIVQVAHLQEREATNENHPLSTSDNVANKETTAELDSVPENVQNTDHGGDEAKVVEEQPLATGDANQDAGGKVAGSETVKITSPPIEDDETSELTVELRETSPSPEQDQAQAPVTEKERSVPHIEPQEETSYFTCFNTFKFW